MVIIRSIIVIAINDLITWGQVGWTMNRYLSMAIRRMEKEERKTQVAWEVPTSLQIISWEW